mgnify:CR=1 FL=1
MTATSRLRIAINSKSVTVIAITSSVEEQPPTVSHGTCCYYAIFVAFCQETIKPPGFLFRAVCFAFKPKLISDFKGVIKLTLD